jgi:heptaprenyl diphosphate synthase
MSSPGKRRILKRLLLMALLTAMAILLNAFDMALTLPVPSVRIGLSHILTIVALYTMGRKEALLVVLFKVLLSALLLGKLASPSFFIALAGNIAAVFFLTSGFRRMSLIPLSIGGAFCNNLGQIIVVYFFFIPRTELLWYFFLMLLGGTVSGLLIGLLAGLIIKRVNHAVVDL